MQKSLPLLFEGVIESVIFQLEHFEERGGGFPEMALGTGNRAVAIAAA